MTINTPRPVEFHSLKQLLNRLNANRESEREKLISVEESDVPNWQRQIVWTDEEKGLLIYSIIQNYPIGMIVLWRKKNGIRVPIDGRQRLTAIREFYEGKIAIPDLKVIPDRFKRVKFVLGEGDEEKGFTRLDLDYREIFEDYEPSIVEYENIAESKAMDIFVKLQGGKPLTKTEVRAALGGKLCNFVTELTSGGLVVDVDSEEEEPPSAHPFFQRIGVNIRNTRKAHRNICDVLLHEFLNPGQDKHWSSLETMYLDKAKTLNDKEKAGYRTALRKFHRAVEITKNGGKIILPQLRSTFLILTFFKVWKEIYEKYAPPEDYSFSDIVTTFETQRVENKDDIPWVNFTAALSNAGYAQTRIETRHKILMSYILRRYPSMRPKAKRRFFTEEEKLAIWDRAGGRCEWVDNKGKRCKELFADFHLADADHIVKWAKGGPTTLENGRLLCKKHNRGRK